MTDRSYAWFCTIHHYFPPHTPLRTRCSQPRWGLRCQCRPKLWSSVLGLMHRRLSVGDPRPAAWARVLQCQTTFGERYLLFGPLFCSYTCPARSSIEMFSFAYCTDAISVIGYCMRSHSAFCPSSPCQFHYSPPCGCGCARAPCATKVVPKPFGARLRVRQGSAQRLAIVLYFLGVCTSHCRWYRDHLVHVGTRLHAYKGRTYSIFVSALLSYLYSTNGARETLYTFVSMAARYRAALTQCIVYRL